MIWIFVTLVGLANVSVLLLILRELRRRSVGQSVTASSQRQVVGPSTKLVRVDLPEHELHAKEEARWLKDQRNKVMEKLAKEFPRMTTERRRTIADEILAKGRAALARIP
jgi:hypothetical protein